VQSPLYVNIRIKNLRDEDLDFLALQKLQPEVYFSGEDIDEISGEKLEKISGDLEKRKFQPAFHAPFYDLNPGAHDPKIREVTQERLLWAVKAAKQIGAKQMVVHPCHGPWVLEKHFETWLERAKSTLSTVVAKALENGLKIAFENIYDTIPEDLLTLINLFPKDQVGVCFDLGHFNLFSEASIKHWFEVLGPRILEVHLHDNLGTRDDHIAVGDGTVKFSGLVSWLKLQEVKPMLTLEMEQKTHVIKSVNRVREWFETTLE